MLKEAREEEEQDGQSEEAESSRKPNQITDQNLSMKARLYGNPTPFPNEALLEKLSNKLAQEEKEI
jgi:hypothetical protein